MPRLPTAAAHGAPPFLLAVSMSMGTPIEIFTGGTAIGAQGTRPCMVGAAAGAGAQQAGGLAEGAGGTSGHDQKDGMPQTVSPHGCSDPPAALS